MLDFHKRGVKDLLEQDKKIGAWGFKYAVLFANKATEQQMPKPQDTEENLNIVNTMRSKSDEFVKTLNTVYNHILADRYTSIAVNYGEVVKIWNEMVGLLSFKTNNEFTKQKLETMIMNGENVLKEIIYRYQGFLNQKEVKENAIGASLAYSAYKIIYNKMRTKNLTPITQNEITANLVKELNTDLSSMQNKSDILSKFQSNDVELFDNVLKRYEEEHGRKPTEAEKETLKKNLILSGNLRHIVKNPVFEEVYDIKKKALEEVDKIKTLIDAKKAQIRQQEGILKRARVEGTVQGIQDKIKALENEVVELEEKITAMLQGKGKAKANRILKKQITQQHAGNEITYDPEKQSFFK